MSDPESLMSSQLFPDLDLSQETMDQVLGAVGFMTANGKILSDCYIHHDQDGTEEPCVGEVGGQESSIAVRRAIFSHSEGQIPEILSQQSSHSSVQLPASALSVSSSAVLSASSYSHPLSSVLLRDSPPMVCGTDNSLASPSSSALSSAMTGRTGNGHSSAKHAVPINVPMEGEYGFRLLLEQPKEHRNFRYSSSVKRAYIQPNLSIPFNFTMETGEPPAGSLLRVMGIHSSAENIGDSLTCCAKHIDLNKKKGFLFPSYFVRPASAKRMHFCEHHSGRLSVVTPLSDLQKKEGSPSQYTVLYTFPCFTSDFSKTAQQVQLIFSLEQRNIVLGRCTLDVRVCCSTSRDRDNDEKKMNGFLKRCGRKRCAADRTEVTTCTLPPKRVCQGLTSPKKKFTIETYPEVFPHLEMCARMMEKVYCFPPVVDSEDTDPPSKQLESSARPSSFESIETWLAHLGLSRYRNMLGKEGITELFQVLSVTEKDLESWGVMNEKHRTTFIEGKQYVRVIDDREGSPDLFPASQSSQPLLSSQLCSSQSGRNIQRTQSFEVLEITVKKSICSSSNESN